MIANVQRPTERSGSRMSILGGFRQSVSRATVCLLGQPKKAIGHESQIEPWLAIATRCLQAHRKPPEKTRTKMTPRASRESEKENRARAKCMGAANRGWMSEKYPLPAGQEKCFYLTSPFIEPDPHQRHPLQPDGSRTPHRLGEIVRSQSQQEPCLARFRPADFVGGVLFLDTTIDCDGGSLKSR